MFSENTILETKRLFLREMNMEDYEALYAVLADSDIMKHYPYTKNYKKIVGQVNESGHSSKESQAAYSALGCKHAEEIN